MFAVVFVRFRLCCRQTCKIVTDLRSFFLRKMSFPDPREEARTYLQSKGVLDLFQELGTLLMYHKPSDPRSFLIEQLQLLQEKQKAEILGSGIFTQDDVKTLFGMFDPTGKGSISAAQCKQGKKRTTVHCGNMVWDSEHNCDGRDATRVRWKCRVFRPLACFVVDLQFFFSFFLCFFCNVQH